MMIRSIKSAGEHDDLIRPALQAGEHDEVNKEHDDIEQADSKQVSMMRSMEDTGEQDVKWVHPRNRSKAY